MNLLKRAGRKLGQSLGLDFVNPNTMFYPDQWWGDSETEEGGQRKGVYTDAFWLAPPFGRPRQIDYERLEPLENSIWVRMCVQHIVDSIAGAEWVVGPRRHGEDVSEKFLAEIREFFESDTWGESWGQIVRQCLPDLVNYDAGVLNKVFSVVSYNTEGELKPNAKPLELVALDGRSLMKDVGLFKNLKGYYQYSWINPQGIPIHFDKEEIIYLQQSPSPRKPYGTSSLEVIESVLDYMMDSTLAQSKYWKNGLFIGGQIDLPEVKDINELKRMQAYFEAKLRGPRKYNKWLITGGGAKVQSLPFTSQQMQWLDSQKWFAKMVFAIFKLTPSELGFTEDLNRATGIQQMEIHKSKGVRPILKILEEAINREIIWRHFSPDISYSYTQELSLDEKKLQSDIDATRLSNNLDSVNELRDRDGKEKWPGEQYDGPNSDAETEEPEDDFDWGSMFAEEGESGEEKNPKDEEDVKKGGEGSGIKGHKTIKEIKEGSTYQMSFKTAWKLRAKHAYPGEMTQKRTEEAMERIREGMAKGRFDPIEATKEELKGGILTEGKHRLLIAKERGIKKIPIKIITPTTKAARAEAVSGEPGFVPTPEAYDGMKKPIKTKKREKELSEQMKAIYKEIEEEIDQEVDRYFSVTEE